MVVGGAAANAKIGSAAFVSDLHLAPGDALRLNAFERFLGALGAQQIEALFVLGDLFDAWPGDDFLDDPFASRVARLLKRCKSAGMALYFMAGNRDFLIGAGFEGASAITILPDPSAFLIANRAMLLSHGDLLCTDDLAYQQFRREVRSAEWQSRFLAQPLQERQRVVAELRAGSEHAKAGKPAELMDVNAAAVFDLLRAHPGATLLHGHTHRPGRHQIEVDQLLRERWVLPDWDLHADPVRGGGILARDGTLRMIGIDGMAM